MKKVLSIFLATVLCFCMVACGGEKPAETPVETPVETNDNYTQIGTSAYSVILPEGYAEGEDEFDEDQIAYYFKDDQSVDFDVYQWDKDGKYTLAEEAEFYANEYGVTAEAVEINGISGMKYTTKEIYEESEYTVANYMFEDEKSIIELCFWTVDTEEEYKAIEEILGTLKKN